MWGVNWVNLQMMINDKPWYDYDKEDEEKEITTLEQEQAIFGKYAKR